MAVASAAKVLLLSGSLLDKWRQVISPFCWQLMTAAARTLSYLWDPSVHISLYDPWVSRCSLKLAWASSLITIYLLTPSMMTIPMCYWWKIGWPQGEKGIDLCRGQSRLYLETNGICCGWLVPLRPFGLCTYTSHVVWSNSCRVLWSGLLMQGQVFR